ncbi:hypothetical protein ANCDUO_00935 [Ancylostoma duodenale]|uniref:Uncharacterized protein n=1 Tax=Ancylostoma duodenale TaxID=51022 RepID=A0A0C2H4J4_9BILA|nr:hypothetical protein ANCDUO_00935 [Ancylostoma duodenale]
MSTYSPPLDPIPQRKCPVNVDSQLVLYRCENQTYSLFNEPLILTISPKIWNILDTRAAVITKYVKSYPIPDNINKDTMLDYKITDMYVEDFSMPKSGVSFKEMKNGIHLRIFNVFSDVRDVQELTLYVKVTDIKFRAGAKAKVAVGVKKLKASLKGDVRGGMPVQKEPCSQKICIYCTKTYSLSIDL